MKNNMLKLKKSPWPWPKVDIKEFSDLALQNKIIFPGIGVYDLGENPKWFVDNEVAINSKRLWINSLQFVHVLIECYNNTKDEKYIIHAKYLFENYFASLNANKILEDVAWNDEHAVANRMFVLVAMLFQRLSGNFIAEITEVKLLDLIEVHANWLMKDVNYKKNNHGVMMDMALINAAILVSDISKSNSDVWLAKAVKRSGDMLVQTFDSMGCCTENSPAYHFVNYALFNSMWQLLISHEINFPSIGVWKSILAKARVVGNIIVRQDGLLPLIGDTESKVGCYFPFELKLPLPQFGFYPESGLFIFKDENLYFSIRSGGSTYSHRHVDDSSITLFINGKDYIVDAGLYSYDGNDKLRRWFTSPLAHSGFYIDSANQARYSNFDAPKSIGGFNDLMQGENHFNISAWHCLSTEAVVNRMISKELNSITIVDSFSSNVNCSWVQRFNIHPDCRIEIFESNKLARIYNDNQFIEIEVETEGYQFEIENNHYSEKFLSRKDACALVVKGKCSSLTLSTVIKFK